MKTNQDPCAKPGALIGFAPTPGSGRRLYRCTVCMRVGYYGRRWSHFATPRIEDSFPALVIYCCSAKCQTAADAKIETDEWQLPRIGGGEYLPHVSRDQKGYRAQPSQEKLREAFARQNLSQNDKITHGPEASDNQKP